MTRDEAITALVERDVARWGEAERKASRQRRDQLSHGLALNALAHYDVDAIDGAIDEALAAEAQRVMTAADRKILREGR